MKTKVIPLAKSQASKIRSLPIPLGLAVCALIGFFGVWLLAWALDLVDRITGSTLFVFVCMGAIVFLCMKMKKAKVLVFLIRGLFGIVVVAFSGFCLALLLSAVTGLAANTVNDFRIPLTIAATGVTALGVYWADLQRIFASAKTSPEPNNNRERSVNN